MALWWIFQVLAASATLLYLYYLFYHSVIICLWRHLLTKLSSLLCSYRFSNVCLLHLIDARQAAVRKYHAKNHSRRGSRRKGLQPTPRLAHLKNDSKGQIPAQRHIRGAVIFHFLYEVQKRPRCPRVLYVHSDSLPFPLAKIHVGGGQSEALAICGLSWEIIVKWVSLLRTSIVETFLWIINEAPLLVHSAVTSCLAVLTSKNNNSVTSSRAAAEQQTHCKQIKKKKHLPKCFKSTSNSLIFNSGCRNI